MKILASPRTLYTLSVFTFLIPAMAIAQTVDLTWTFGNVGSASYRLDAFTPSGAGLGAIGSEDPALLLELGKRYEVKVTNYVVHPLEILAKGTSAA